MISYHPSKNIFKSNAEALVNPVNCRGVMGAGLALAFKKRYPSNYKQYRESCKENLLDPGGILVHFSNADGKIILNLATKNYWTAKSQLSYVTNGMQELLSIVDAVGIPSVAIPQLGCGLGGLSWNQVCPAITKIIAQGPQRLNQVDFQLYGPEITTDAK
jgi:O-acetyl-ADP-ribose deacetylase (regulator of RNase III)